MSKVHQLLAVEPVLKKKANEALAGLRGLLKANQAFIGQTRTYQPKEDEGHVFPAENVVLQNTVDYVLDESLSAFAEHMDLQLQKEASNANTSANVVVDGVTIVEDLPAPALLNLEARLEELKALYDSVPTNPTDVRWVWNGNTNAWDSEPRITDKMKKEQRPLVLHEGTDKHAPQVQIITDDVIIGQWHTQLHSGMLSPNDLKERQHRLQKLLVAVKRAIREANDGEVVSVNIGNSVLKYVNTGMWE